MFSKLIPIFFGGEVSFIFLSLPFVPLALSALCIVRCFPSLSVHVFSPCRNLHANHGDRWLLAEWSDGRHLHRRPPSQADRWKHKAQNISDILDDANTSTIHIAKMKSFLDSSMSEAFTVERWTAAKFVKHQLRIVCASCLQIWSCNSKGMSVIACFRPITLVAFKKDCAHDIENQYM